jgi:uncharacterized protein (DUF58 family)
MESAAPPQQNLRRRLEEQLSRWLPAAQQGEVLKLGLRNLYIVPTGFGWLWLGGGLLLHLVGIQTQSNGPLLLSFVMFALQLLSLHLTHGQLEGLEVRCAQPEPAFAGESATYPLIVRVKSACEGLEWRLGAGAFHGVGSLGPGEHQLAVAWTPHQRGWQRPGKLRLQTTAPLGLFVCWSHWLLPTEQLIYPARNPGPVRQVPMADWREKTAAAGSLAGQGAEEWLDLRPHRRGDSSSRLAWKLLAQGRGAQTKRFQDPRLEPSLLAPDPAVPREQALEHLCDRLCQLHRQGQSYGLALTGLQIPPDRGSSHRDRCLEALALCRP